MMTSLQSLFCKMKQEHPEGFYKLTENQEDSPMIVECAYCGVLIGTKKGKKVGGISHGICDTCKPLVMTEIDADTIEKKSRIRALLYLRKNLKETRKNGLKIRFSALQFF